MLMGTSLPDRLQAQIAARDCLGWRLKRRSLELSFGEIVGVTKPAVDSPERQT